MLNGYGDHYLAFIAVVVYLANNINKVSKIKKLIIASLTGFSSVVFATNWELIGENRNREKAYLDEDSITDNNDYKAVWEKLGWKDGGYSLVHIVYYCPSRMYIYAEIVKYNKKDKQGAIVAYQPAIERPVAYPFEHLQPRQGHHLSGPQAGLGVFGQPPQPVVYLAEQVGDKVYCSHVRLHRR